MASKAIETLKNKLVAANAAKAKIRENLEGTVPEMVSTAEVAVGSAAAGFIDEAFGSADENGIYEHKIQGVPTSLGLGGLLVVAAATKTAGKSSGHLWDLGKGFLASYGNVLGRGAGVQRRKANGATS